MMRAACKSCKPLVNHSLVSRARASSIEFAAALQNLVLDGGPQMPIAIKLLPSLNKYVFTHVQVAKTVMRALHPADSPLTAFGDDHHQIHVAIVMGCTPSV